MRKLKKRKSVRVPYNELTDDEKIEKNWTKALALFKRQEWSVAILRSATCLELVVNFAVREELIRERGLPLTFVDKLLRNANGIHNKFNNIYLPIMDEYEQADGLKKLWLSKISRVNEERNAVAHRGEFRGKKKAIEAMANTYAALVEIMTLHGGTAKLKVFER